MLDSFYQAFTKNKSVPEEEIKMVINHVFNWPTSLSFPPLFQNTLISRPRHPRLGIKTTKAAYPAPTLPIRSLTDKIYSNPAGKVPGFYQSCWVKDPHALKHTDKCFPDLSIFVLNCLLLSFSFFHSRTKVSRKAKQEEAFIKVTKL